MSICRQSVGAAHPWLEGSNPNLVGASRPLGCGHLGGSRAHGVIATEEQSVGAAHGQGGVVLAAVDTEGQVGDRGLQGQAVIGTQGAEAKTIVARLVGRSPQDSGGQVMGADRRAGEGTLGTVVGKGQVPINGSLGDRAGGPAAHHGTT